MNIGKNCYINDRFFPKELKIDISDSKGNKLSIEDKVKIKGCATDYGYIGYDGEKVCLYFAGQYSKDDTAVSAKWFIDKDVLSRITLIS